MKKPKKTTTLSTPQLQAHIRSTAQNSINVLFTEHVKQRMRQRKITMPCVLETLRKGQIKRQPEPNTSYGTLECRMEFYSAGHNIGVVVAVSDEDPSLVVVTAMYI
jgi:hypothetical protein